MALRIDREDRRNFLLLVVYAALLHILFISFFKYTFQYSSRGKLFIYDFNSAKYAFCLLETLIIICFTVKKVKIDGLAERIMLLLNMLYFLPGVVQQAATNAPWGYIFYYLAFWVGMEAWLKLIKPRPGSRLGKYIKVKNIYMYMAALTVLAIGVVFFMGFYTGRVFSISNLLEAMHDTYGVRADAKEQSIHWILLNFEYWAAYFMVIMIALYTERKKYLLVLVLLLAEAALFVIQGNRIIMFLAFAAVGIGLLSVDNKKLTLGLLLIMAIILVEVIVRDSGFLFTNVFRRYSVVPNRLGEQYYDYFLTHEPDLLRTRYNRIFRLLGITSPYTSSPIGLTIGKQYYGTMMNANNGLVGGSMYVFKFAAPVISTFGYIFGFRMFESATYSIRNTRVSVAIALILATLAINSSSLLASIFALTYFMMLYLCLIPLSSSEMAEDLRAVHVRSTRRNTI